LGRRRDHRARLVSCLRFCIFHSVCSEPMS
jgi:hypothetical protein